MGSKSKEKKRKISCFLCKKSCKGQAIHLQDRYFHVKCFKCKECSKQLHTGGFYGKDDDYYCTEDYQRLFGTKCAACNKYVEGEVVTALGSTYHKECFHCSKCKTDFDPGDKVTFNGKDYLCTKCMELVSSAATTPVSPSKAKQTFGQPPRKTKTSPGKVTPLAMQRGPMETSTPARPQQMSDGELELGSPMSDGIPSSVDHREKLSPIQNIMQYRSPSPASSMASSRKSTGRESTGSWDRRSEPDYGRFYKQSFLKGQEEEKIYKRGPSLNPSSQPKSPHFHRPENFSYSAVRRDFIRPMKKENSTPFVPSTRKPKSYSGMMSALGDAETLQNKGTKGSRAYGVEEQEAIGKTEMIKMSKFAGAHRPESAKLKAIERDDWPAPPDPAAAFPELLRDHRGRRKSGGSRSGSRAGSRSASRATSDAEDTAGEETAEEMMDEDEEEEEEEKPLDPQTQKEVDLLQSLKDKSGAARMVLEDIKKSRAHSPVLDPRSSSRAPAADREPHYKTRYESPIFASPSRDTEFRPRLHSMDEKLMAIKYRTSTVPSANFPVNRKGMWEQPVSLLAPRFKAPKPGYGLKPATRAAHRNGHYSALEGGEYSASERGYVSEDGLERRRPFRLRTDPGVVERGYVSEDGIERKSYHTSQSSFEDDMFDPETGLRRRSKLRGSMSSTEAGLHYPTYLSYRRSIPKIFQDPEEPPPMYSYEELKITNYQLPPGVDRNTIERHLSKDEFESIFHMPREEFYRLAEWKRNDLKRRVQLF